MSCESCFSLFRQTCAISNPDTVVVTGALVSVFNSEQGWLEDLPPLTTGRMRHACAGYTLGGKRVRLHRLTVDRVKPLLTLHRLCAQDDIMYWPSWM